MKTIFIKYQDAQGQYDEDYNQITEWNDKYCSWVVLPEYEEAYNKGEIDWWGDNNDFPSGETMANSVTRGVTSFSIKITCPPSSISESASLPSFLYTLEPTFKYVASA